MGMKRIVLAATTVALASLTSTLTAADMNSSTKTAVVGGGCFWCTEAMYHSVPGVLSVVSGYAGGTTPHPTYEQVCSGNTGHAEVVQITYDPSKISYEKIIDLFWKAHDPTTLNRQGADTGTQYRSIILYQTDEERQIAEKSKAAAQKDYKDPIVTEIKPLDTFWPAEKYHQDFYENNPNYPYSAAVIEPKLEKFRKATQDK
jgi:peptide-methionine (S)-S-oxide reductase